MYLQLAKRNLMRNKARSVLAVIGIVIGVMAVASIGIFGESLKATVLENFQNVANEVIVTPAYSKGYVDIDEKTVAKIKKIPYVKEAIAVKNGWSTIEVKSKRGAATIYGMEEKAGARITPLVTSLATSFCIAGMSSSVGLTSAIIPAPQSRRKSSQIFHGAPDPVRSS